MLKVLSLFLLLILPQLAFSQTDHSDCTSAYHVTDFTEILEFQPFLGNTTVDVLDPEECMSEEFQPTWLKFQVASAGNFFFTITPKDDNKLDDLDFLVFKTDSLDVCTHKETIRCMASGETVGQDSTPCFGETGLSPDETDTEENPGCAEGDNNFLAALDCQAGDTYLILINNFTRSGQPFCIQFFGSAIITETDTEDLESTSYNPRIYPNPAMSTLIIPNANNAKVTITNLIGQTVIEEIMDQDKLNISHLPNGKYFISVNGHIQSFLKI